MTESTPVQKQSSAIVVAVTNQKGGVGKTTTAVNMASSLAALKKRVLLIDLDPQGNATIGCGVRLASSQLSVCDLLLGRATFSQVVCGSRKGLDVLPSDQNLTIAEVQLLQREDRETCLKLALADVVGQYDVIFLDCPPALNVLTLNALVAASSVLIPVQCEYYALEGLANLLKTVEHLRQRANPSLHIEGIVRTMYDGRNRLAVDVSAKLLQHFGDRVYHTVIPRNVRLAEAPSYGKPVLNYDKRSQGAVAYLALAAEFLRRQSMLPPSVMAKKREEMAT